VFRYLALIWDVSSPEPAILAARLQQLACSPGSSWRREYQGAGLAVLVAGHCAGLGVTRLANGNGIVLGETFARERPMSGDATSEVTQFSERETRKIIANHGRRLISHYWGNYVALLIEDKNRYVLKDPAGPLPCYLTEHAGVRVIFSCLADCQELMGLRFTVNWQFVRNYLCDGVYEVETDPLLEVTCVHRGECVRLDDTGRVLARTCYWHPMHFAQADERIDDPALAERMLRSAVRGSVHAFAAHHAGVLQQTSGGLDSSIVLGCLGDAPKRPTITCYTNYVPDSVCDERRWARSAAEHGNHRHVEVACDPAKLLFDELPALAPSVEPGRAFAHWQRGPVERQLAHEHAATATFTGEGGDATFCSTCYVLAVDSTISRYGMGLRTLRMAVSVATRRDRSVWKTLSDTARRQVSGTRLDDHRATLADAMQLVAAGVKERKVNHFPNPWFRSMDRVPLETLHRLGTLAFRPSFYDLSTSQHATAPHAISALCAQPVFEVAARIPVDIHFDGGRVRGLARRAFIREVPESILRRQWKDRPLLQPGQVVQQNVQFIREALLDGALVGEQLLDRAAVELCLLQNPTKSRTLSGEVLRHLELELWIRRIH
jgi:asparagine synthase (glutamine-hydrolysing)